WLTPDPGGKNVVHLDDPQTWNMYAYVRNNPTTLTDPTGLRVWGDRCDTGDEKCQEERQAARDAPTTSTGQAQNTCKYDACVTAQAPKKSFWGRVGGWFRGAAV